ncbi:MAG TPA: GMC family oxidoreductase N-terminal domain-containing protein [Pseudonocardiaceae bacterium]|nr:GMC family oxidoreductase N-terminal domain-containing protein [Pseudonocardiaceae bacterium]
MSGARYDYVIVGAGSAGCVLAARLCADPDVTVCLIEAGPSDDIDEIRIPVAGGALRRTRYDWDYDTHDEPFCGGRRLFLPRGKVLGGCSSLNGQVHIRGNRLDFDEWGPGWSYAELLPYFLRCEDNERGASAYHGVGGPLAVSENRSRNPMCTSTIEAAVHSGYSANDDFNGATQDGFGYYQVTQRNGRRCNTASAYLRPRPPNLTVRTNLHVEQVLLTGTTATGVRCRQLDTVEEIHAEREVILAAGAYNSPQLLMLSGIGPADHLDAVGVPVVVDHPEVGRNLQDHPSVYLVFGHDEPISVLSAGTPENVRLFTEENRGPLTSNAPEAGGFVRTSAGLPAPDIQFHALPLMFVEGALAELTEHGYSFGPTLLKPASRGAVTLASADPSAKPRIRHRYYAEPGDLDTMVAGLHVALDITRQAALRQYTVRPVSVPDSESDEDLRTFTRAKTESLFHPAGTCAIGTVVDQDLKVLGIDGLRVVDASVMPTLTRGNINAPIIAIAERAADLISGTQPLRRATAA